MRITCLLLRAAVTAVVVSGVALVCPAQAAPAAAVGSARTNPTATALAVPDTCFGVAATIVGTGGPDELEGTDGVDVVSLGGGHDVFNALGGDDLVCGGGGSDSLYGGPGNDRVDGGRAADYLHGDLCRRYDDHCQPGDGEDLLRGGRGHDILALHSGEGADQAVGGDGTDMVSYQDAPMSVTIDVGAGTVTSVAVDVLDSMEAHQGTSLGDVIVGTDGDDTLLGSAGEDHITGGAGDDLLAAEDGSVDGGPGDDTYNTNLSAYPAGVLVALGPGADIASLEDEGFGTVLGGRGRDQIRPAGTDDGVDASGYSFKVGGGPGADVLSFRRYPGRLVLDVAAGVANLRGDEEVRFSGFSTYLGTRFFGDVLRGSAEGERLIGLGGRDVADGRGGRDACRAEVRRRCER